MEGPLSAVEQICRMRGGSQPHLMRCSDSAYYVVKFQNNPQGARILANELLGTLLARALELPVPDPAIINVRKTLIDLTWDMVIELRNGRVPCRAGTCFGSRHPSVKKNLEAGSPPMACDFIAEDSLCSVENLVDFLGMYVFDKWTCNTDTRQVVFARANIRAPFKALMIDQGFCFNGIEWNFPDIPRRGLYLKKQVYGAVRGIDSFEPWLKRLETDVNAESIAHIAAEIPREWFAYESGALSRLVTCLDQRRKNIRDLIWSAWKLDRQTFPNWNCRVAVAGAQ
jgi:hypothetical protein